MKRFLYLVVGALLLVPAFCWAEENEDAEAAQPQKATKSFADYAKMGSGVYNIKTDEAGEIKSLIAVGTSRISTVLGASKGKEVARRKASMVADAELVKFLKTNLTIEESNTDETLFVLKGSEDSSKEGEDSLNEEGKSSETSMTKITTYAQHMLRGMQVLHTDIQGEGKEYVVVKGLNLKTLKSVKKLSGELSSDESDSNEDAFSGSSSNSGASGGSSRLKNAKKIKSESHSAPGAEEFL